MPPVPLRAPALPSRPWAELSLLPQTRRFVSGLDACRVLCSTRQAPRVGCFLPQAPGQGGLPVLAAGLHPVPLRRGDRAPQPHQSPAEGGLFLLEVRLASLPHIDHEAPLVQDVAVLGARVGLVSGGPDGVERGVGGVTGARPASPPHAAGLGSVDGSPPPGSPGPYPSRGHWRTDVGSAASSWPGSAVAPFHPPPPPRGRGMGAGALSRGFRQLPGLRCPICTMGFCRARV